MNSDQPGIEVVQPGLATTIQDLGRLGYYNVGIPPGGAMDLASAAAANLLVGNDEGAAVLESPYQGPTLRFHERTVVAVTGATMATKVDGDEVPQWASIEVEAGSELSFGHLQGGARLYIAVAGGIDVPEVLGSRSTYAIGALGGLEGRALQAGDTLPIGRAEGRAGRSVPEHLRPTFAREIDCRVMLGLYDHRLAPEGLETFLDATWELTPVADRMGLRYSGPELAWKEREQPFGAGSDPSNIVDAGYPVGSIQVPGGVEPIILHRDAVSGGGYAMVATVISADMDLVAQCSPGTKTSFVDVSMEKALEIRGEARQRRDELRALLA